MKREWPHQGRARQRSVVGSKNCLIPDRDMEEVRNACLLLFNSFRNDLFQKEGFLTICTLGFSLVRNDKQAAAFGTGLFERSLPRSEIATRIVLTTKECASFACFPFHEFATILGAWNTDLLKPGFGITTGGEVRARNEFSKPPVADDQLTAILRAFAPDR